MLLINIVALKALLYKQAHNKFLNSSIEKGAAIESFLSRYNENTKVPAGLL